MKHYCYTLFLFSLLLCTALSLNTTECKAGTEGNSGNSRITTFIVEGDTITTCPQSSDTLVVRLINDGTQVIDITSFNFSPNTKEFRFNNPNDAGGLSLSPGETRETEIIFHTFSCDTFLSELIIRTNLKPISDFTAYFLVDMPSINLMPVDKVMFPGDTAEITTMLHKSIKTLNVNEFLVSYYFDPNILTALDVKPGSALAGRYGIADGYPIIAGDSMIVKIQQTTAKGIINSDSLLTARFKVLKYFNDDSVTSVKAHIQTKGNDSICNCGNNQLELVIKQSLNISSSGIHKIIPNPAYEKGTTVYYTVLKEAFTKIEVYNTLGQLVMRPVNSSVEPGEYTFFLDTKNLPIGHYIIYMKSGDTSDMKRFIVGK